MAGLPLSNISSSSSFVVDRPANEDNKINSHALSLSSLEWNTY